MIRRPRRSPLFPTTTLSRPAGRLARAGIPRVWGFFCRPPYLGSDGVRQMIARVGRGGAPRSTAADYQRHYESEVKDHLRAVSGFRSARLLRRDDDQEVMFTSITFFASLDAVRDFAGDDYELAVVEEAARRALSG